MFTYVDIQNEVKRRAVLDQGGTTFDTAIKNIINTSLFRLGRECPWRVLRRKSFFDTVTSYTTGSGAASATTSSVNVTITGANMITADVYTARKIKLSGDGTVYEIRTITGNTTLTLDMLWGAATTTAMTYEIYPQEEYLLPIQASHRIFLWHEDYGYPYQLEYMTEQDFISQGYQLNEKGTPLRYRMWGEDMVRQQPKQAGVLTIQSTSNSDTSIDVTIFGVAGGYPTYEIITTNATNGTATVAGSVSFSSVERISKSTTSVGRINVYADTATSTTVAVMPIGDTTAGILYKKIKLHPLPTRIFPINVQYYKDPYRLVNDNDVHELGQEFDEALILLSVAKIKSQNQQNEAGGFFNMYLDELRSLRRTNMDKLDWFPTLRKPWGQGNNGRVVANLQYRQAGSNFGPSSRR